MGFLGLPVMTWTNSTTSSFSFSTLAIGTAFISAREAGLISAGGASLAGRGSSIGAGSLAMGMAGAGSLAMAMAGAGSLAMGMAGAGSLAMGTAMLQRTAFSEATMTEDMVSVSIR